MRVFSTLFALPGLAATRRRVASRHRIREIRLRRRCASSLARLLGHPWRGRGREKHRNLRNDRRRRKTRRLNYYHYRRNPSCSKRRLRYPLYLAATSDANSCWFGGEGTRGRGGRATGARPDGGRKCNNRNNDDNEPRNGGERLIILSSRVYPAPTAPLRNKLKSTQSRRRQLSANAERDRLFLITARAREPCV